MKDTASEMLRLHNILSANKKKYILGFYFSPDRTQVYLLRKNYPDWQKGKLNGFGGHLEEKDYMVDNPNPIYDLTLATLQRGMVREFKEETSLHTEPYEWSYFATVRSHEWELHCFHATALSWPPPRFECDEGCPEIHSIDMIPDECVYNIKWLIPMALDRASVIGSIFAHT